MRKASRRHWAAAEELRDGTSRSVAGYLYGIACECAVKQRMHDAGLREGGERRADPFYAHFPQLKTLLRDEIEGRGTAELLQYCAQNFMAQWAIEMRYSDGTAVDSAAVERWRTDAETVLAEL